MIWNTADKIHYANCVNTAAAYDRWTQSHSTCNACRQSCSWVTPQPTLTVPQHHLVYVWKCLFKQFCLKRFCSFAIQSHTRAFQLGNKLILIFFHSLSSETMDVVRSAMMRRSETIPKAFCAKVFFNSFDSCFGMEMEF